MACSWFLLLSWLHFTFAKKSFMYCGIQNSQGWSYDSKVFALQLLTKKKQENKMFSCLYIRGNLLGFLWLFFGFVGCSYSWFFFFRQLSNEGSFSFFCWVRLLHLHQRFLLAHKHLSCLYNSISVQGVNPYDPKVPAVQELSKKSYV